jgi:hypothetical protein
MANFEGSDKVTFCWQDPTLGPLKMAECPTYEGDESSDGSNASARYIGTIIFMAVVVTLLSGNL